MGFEYLLVGENNFYMDWKNKTLVMAKVKHGAKNKLLYTQAMSSMLGYLQTKSIARMQGLKKD